MSANYIPSNLPVDPSRDANAVAFPQAWPAALGQAAAEEPGIPWGRYVAALRRYKWLILAIAAGLQSQSEPEPELTRSIDSGLDADPQ